MYSKRLLDQNCQNCSKSIPTDSQYVTVRQFFYHADCLICRFCKKLLTPDTTDLINNLPYCLGHRGKEVAINAECPHCNKKFSTVQMPGTTLTVHGLAYHKGCASCRQCQKTHPEIALDKFRVVDSGQLYCQGCWEVKNPVKCDNCHALVLPSQSNDTSGGAKFCAKCFICTNCQIKLKAGEKHFDLGGKLYCCGCENKYEEARFKFQHTKSGP